MKKTRTETVTDYSCDVCGRATVDITVCPACGRDYCGYCREQLHRSDGTEDLTVCKGCPNREQAAGLYDVFARAVRTARAELYRELGHIRRAHPATPVEVPTA